MAKFGPQENAGFDPFERMGDAIDGLDGSPTAVQEPPAQVAATKKRRTANKPKRQTTKPRPSAATVPDDCALTTTKKFKVSDEESSNLEMAAMRMSMEIGSKIDLSKLLRAICLTYLRNEKDILRAAPKKGDWARPANNDAIGLAEMDDRLSRIVEEGLMMAGRRITKPE